MITQDVWEPDNLKNIQIFQLVGFMFEKGYTK